MSKSFALVQKYEINDINKLIQNQLQSLCEMLGKYFPDLNDFDFKQIRNPFEVDSRLLHNLQDKFVKLLNDSTAKDIFKSLILQKFGSYKLNSYQLEYGKIGTLHIKVQQSGRQQKNF